MPELDERLEALAQAPILLVATDFDGTLAPIVSVPEQAEANREALVALRMLSELPQTHVAVISGRAMRDLAQRAGDAGNVHLVGSHGSEFEPGLSLPLPDSAKDLVSAITQEAGAIAARFPGAHVEQKPAALAFHYRNVDEKLSEAVVEAVVRAFGDRPGVFVRHGKRVVELSVVKTDKGSALQRLRQRIGATGVLFIGDDLTDEDAFTVLSGSDVAVKVGAGPTSAPFRIADTVEVTRALARIAESRAKWITGADAVPIEHHSLLSDQRTAALVGPTGRVVWLCLPRIDSSAVFAELLGGPSAGFFEIRAAASVRPIEQRYLGHSMLLETRWPGFTVTDYLDAAGGRAFQRPGRTDLIRAVAGRGRVEVTFAPRLDFGRIATRLFATPGGIVAEGSIDPLVLYAPGINWEIVTEGQHQTARCAIELDDKPVVFELRYGTANLGATALGESIRREQNVRFWQGWVDSLQVPSTAPDMVRRSAVILKALTYGPTGAIAAAPTTSLPECLGAARNWDYRFCWPRDAAIAAHSLVQLGVTGPAMKLLDWMLGILEQSDPASLMSPVYTVSGGHLGAEGEITQLAGYRGSRPVRVGNAAANQVQLDVFGPLAQLIAALGERGAPVTPDHWRLTERMVESVARHWREPDHGIWEIRLPRRQHVHSKVMCWFTLDRALSIAQYLGSLRPEWADVREQIAADVLESGWSKAHQAFGASYEDAAPDAAALWVGLSGLLPCDDPRFLGTLDYVQRTLRKGPTLYRYRFDDGLAGLEGGFNLCTTWLIDALARCNRRAEAQDLFEQYAQLAGPTGLLAEEWCPLRRQALGNYPQAYSHAGLINAAMALAAAPAEGALL